MTIEEFDKTGFAAKDSVLRKGKYHNIHAVDFEEKLIAIMEYGDITWIRCENLEYIKG